jgi:RND family efflux transporter MFP subunit
MRLEPVHADDPAVENRPTTGLGAGVRLSPRQQQLVGVEYGYVEYAPVAWTIHGAAELGLNETRVARVQTKLEGWIDLLNVNSAGQQVKQGQVLFTVYNRQDYYTAQAEYQKAMMDATGMGRPTPRNEAGQKRADQVTLMAARRQLEELGFNDDQIEAVSHSRYPLASFPVVAPITGEIVEYNAALHKKISLDPLLTIADLSTIWATVDFAPADAAPIRRGQAVALSLPYYAGRVFQGKVDVILPAVDPQTRTLKVRMVFDNPDGSLRPGMFGEAKLRVGGGRKYLTTVRDAVVDSGEHQVVFVDLGDGYLEPREVEVGQQFGDRVEIVRGLKAGQRIVTAGNFLLDSESRMNFRR